MPLALQSGTALDAISQESGMPFPLQSGVPAAMSHASGTLLELQSGVSQPSGRPLPLQSGKPSEQTSGMPLPSQSEMAPDPISNPSGMPLPLQSGWHASSTPLVSTSSCGAFAISHESGTLLSLQSASQPSRIWPKSTTLSPLQSSDHSTTALTISNPQPMPPSSE
jgi:hypothetical protein